MTKDMGQFMQEMRKKKGLTQKELAELIGVSDKTISKWETGKGTPDTSMLVPISEAFNITVNELLSGELIPPENYHVKAEETIMALVKENESTKKGTKISVVIGVIVVFGVAPELNTAGIIAANLAVAGLPLLYAMIVRIIVEVMLFRKKYSTPYELKY